METKTSTHRQALLHFIGFATLFMATANSSLRAAEPVDRATPIAGATDAGLSATRALDGAATAPAVKKPKIVILWASLGMGHLSASRSIEAELKKKYPDAEIILKDSVDFQPWYKRKILPVFYDLMTKKNAGGYDKWYRGYMEQGGKIDSPGNLPVASSYQPDELLKYLKDEKPTLVVSTFNHITETLINLRDRGELKKTPIAQVMTDYIDAKYFERMGERVDMSFVPHEALRENWIRNGFPADKVVTAGMPVNPKAFTVLSAAQKAEFLTSKGLNPALKTVLLVSGSAGVGDFPAMVKSMAAESGGKPLQIVAVTAKNEDHFKNLNALAASLPSNVKLQVLGMTPQDDLFNYMKSSDLIVTKTGGLSVSEIAVMQKPLVVLDINGGQETYNSRFFENQGMAISTKDQANVGKKVQEVLADSELQARMIAAQADYRRMVRPAAIADWIVDQHTGSETPRGPPAVAPAPASVTAAPAETGLRPHRVLTMWDEKLVGQARWDSINKENKEIFAVYYLIDGKKIGMAALAGYCQAARRGADVKLIIDGWAPEKWLDAKIEPPMVKALERCGVNVRIFNPVNLSDMRAKLNIETYMRTHDKMTYFGGQGILATGDRNMQNINFRLQKTAGKKGISYRSVETLIQGPAAEDGRAYLQELWDSVRTKPIALPDDVSEESIRKAEAKITRYTNVMKKAPLVEQDWVAKMQPVADVRFLHDSPNFKAKVPGMEVDLLNLIKGAKKSLTILSPYILLPPEFEKEVLAAMARGVQVEILNAAPHATDVALASYAFEKQAQMLMEKGAKVSLHQGPDIMHAKMMIVDGLYTVTTSHNFDGVSLYLNLESGVVVRDEAYTKTVLADIQKMIATEAKPFTPSASGMSACNAAFFRIASKYIMPGAQKMRSMPVIPGVAAH